jgi:hypothetical protein
MTTFPKSIEAPITRFFHAPTRDNKGKKNGGMVAVLKFDQEQWKGDVLVFEPDVDGSEWWNHVSRNAVIRASVREVAKNKEDLIAFALPLKNQPTATQEMVRARIAEESEEKAELISEADKLEEQLKADIEKKQHLETLRQYLPRLRMLIKKGEWLDNNETGLLLAQSAICRAYCEWADDDSPSADTSFTENVLDACKYLVDAMVALRGPMSDGKEPEGTLSVTCRHGSSKTVLDLKHFQ